MNENEIKIGFFGSKGKTAIALSFLKGEFTEGYIPTIEDEFSKVIEIDGQSVSITIIETAGQDDFAEMRFSYFSQVQSVIFFIDITDKLAIIDIINLFSDLQDSTDDPLYYCIAILNSDMLTYAQREDLTSKIDQISSEFKCLVFEISARNYESVDNMIRSLARKVMNKESNENVDVNDIKINHDIEVNDYDVGVSGYYKSSATSLIKRFVYGEMCNEIDEEDIFKYIEIGNSIEKMTFSESDFSPTKTFYKLVNAVVFMFDINDKDTLDEMISCFNKSKEENPNLIKIIAADHCELRKQNKQENGNYVTYEKIKEIENSLNTKVIEVSSQTGENIEELFFILTKEIFLRSKQKNKGNQKLRKKHKNENENKRKDKNVFKSLVKFLKSIKTS